MMRTVKEANELIYDLTKTITDKELFTSNGYLQLITTMVEVATKRYKRTLTVDIVWDEKPNSDAGYTDNFKIHLNAGSNLFSLIKNRYTKHLGVVGLVGHEVGHCLYTDFNEMQKSTKEALAHGWYPFEPIPKNAQEEKTLQEINEAFSNREDSKILYKTILLSLHNSIEDAFVENLMPLKFPGTFRKGIEVMRQCTFETLASIDEMEKSERYQKFEIFHFTLLCFALYGITKGSKTPSAMEKEILAKLNDMKVIILEARFSPVSTNRYIACNYIFLKIWDWLSDFEGKPEEKCKKIEEISSEMSGTPMPTGTGESVEISEKDTEKLEGAKEKFAETLELGELTASGGSGTKTFETYEAEERNIEFDSVLHEIAEEKADVILESELLEELTATIKEIDFPTIHDNVDFVIMRMTDVPNYLINSYDRIKSEIEPLSKQLQKGVLQIFRDKRDGAKLKSLPMGRYISSENLYRDDGKIFYNKKLPVPYPEIAVAVLVDESGSMDNYNRCISAMKAALLLHDFCFKLKIPIMITGHTETYSTGKVELNTYADFDKPDYKNQYRLMDISARDYNRDGAALKYVGHKLLKRSEKHKLLIVISDGQPAAKGYSGAFAHADLREQKKELTRKGVAVFAAAIGDDKPAIKSCYGDGFLDITDMERLPSLLIGLLKKYIK